MSRSSNCEPRRRAPRGALWLGLWLGLASAAASAEQLDEAIDATLARLARQQALPAEPAARSVVRPPRTHYELGAVLDGRPPDGGLPMVMALTPGGAAERIGLRVGDRLRALNGVQLAAADASAQLRVALQAAAGAAELELLRDNQPLHLSGRLDALQLPGYRLSLDAPALPIAALAAAGGSEAVAGGCGRISQLPKPPISQQLFPAVLHEIDGRLPGPLDERVFRLPAGRHVLKVSEAIDDTRFSLRQLQRRGQLLYSERFKYLTVDVAADTTYRLAVRFDKQRREPIKDQAYWEPVIWEALAERCH